MCGIAGVINLDGTPVKRDLLVGMAAQLIHRGPDDFGVWIDGSHGMAHTRLSIIDVEDRGSRWSVPEVAPTSCSTVRS